jgi:tetratricopeptide (TPR) repeat protein
MASARKKSPKQSWLQAGEWQAWALILAVVLAYAPVWWAGYVWDDDKYVTSNPVFFNGADGLKAIWTTRAGDACPVAMTTWWLEHVAWGLSPLSYHLVNVLFQAACGIVLWRVLLRLRVPGAWFGAMLWTLHPVQVESVAWISEMKNTESGLFFLLSILFFLRWLMPTQAEKKAHANRAYFMSLLFAALAMGAKSSTSILPLVLLLVMGWLKELNWRNAARTFPYFLLAIMATVMAIWTFELLPNDDPLAARNWPGRFVDAGYAVWFYLGKLVWPYPLEAIYPWRETVSWMDWLPLAVVVLLLITLWLKRDTWLRPCFFAFAYFLIALVPALGLVSQAFVHYSIVADHLQYLAGMGPLALAGAGFVRLADFSLGPKPEWKVGLGIALIAGLCALSWQQAGKYESQRTLWTDEVTENPGSFQALTNLGNALVQEGQARKAESSYTQALALDPHSATAYSNLGGALFLQGRVDDAIVQYQNALKIDPTRAHTEADLAFALWQKGQLEEAVNHYQRSLTLEPGYADAHYNLGNLFLKMGHVDEALTQYQDAIACRPQYAEAHFNLGNVLLQKGNLDDAIAQYRAAIEIRRDYAEAYNNLGGSLMRKGEVREAAEQFQQAVDVNPQYVDARKNLALAESILSRSPGGR